MHFATVKLSTRNKVQVEAQKAEIHPPFIFLLLEKTRYDLKSNSDKLVPPSKDLTDLWLGRGWGIRVLDEDLALLWTGCHHGAGSPHHHSTTTID